MFKAEELTGLEIRSLLDCGDALYICPLYTPLLCPSLSSYIHPP